MQITQVFEPGWYNIEVKYNIFFMFNNLKTFNQNNIGLNETEFVSFLCKVQR
jgi:hypothetical protein